MPIAGVGRARRPRTIERTGSSPGRGGAAAPRRVAAPPRRRAGSSPDESRRFRGSDGPERLRTGHGDTAAPRRVAAPTRIAPRTVPARAPRRRRDHSSDAAAPPRFKEKKRRRGSRALHHRRGVGHGVDAGLLNLLVQQALLLGDEVPVVRAGPRATSTSPRRLSTDVVAAASPRLLSTEYPRRSRGVTATRPRNIHVAAAASLRRLSTEYPRRRHRVATTPLHGISASRPRRRRDSSKNICAAKSTRGARRTSPPAIIASRASGAGSRGRAAASGRPPSDPWVTCFVKRSARNDA